MYHKITREEKEASNPFCVSPELFEEDIKYMKSNGYKFCFASEIDSILEKTKDGGKYVSITFDDGYESDYTYALPILKKYNVKATFFILGSNLGENDNISKKNLRELSKSPLVEIGNHSLNLHNKPLEEIKMLFLNNEREWIVNDFKQNSKKLEEITGRQIKVLSYPNGIWNSEIDKALRTSGFLSTFTSEAKRSNLSNVPHGRFNRSADLTIEEILNK